MLCRKPELYRTREIYDRSDKIFYVKDLDELKRVLILNTLDILSKNFLNKVKLIENFCNNFNNELLI